MMMSVKFYMILCLGFFFISFSASKTVQKPVIGILSTPSDIKDLYNPEEYSYIKGSYAEFIEAADGIPIAIPWDLPERQLIAVLDSINGVLFTGGDASLWEFDVEVNDMVFSNFTKRAGFVLRYAIGLNEKGIHFPVYGICQGHEVITMEIAGTPHVIDNYHHPGQLSFVDITAGGKSSRMFKNMPEHIGAFIRQKRSIYYNHRYGFNTSLLHEQRVLNDFFSLTAKGVDENGKEFIAALEAKKYPIFTVQYHPERILSEWKNKTQFHHPRESAEAVLIQAAFFVNEARKNEQKFSDAENMEKYLLKNHEGVYINTTWPNTYFYDKKSLIEYHVNPDWSDNGDIDQYVCDHDACDDDTLSVDFDL